MISIPPIEYLLSTKLAGIQACMANVINNPNHNAKTMLDQMVDLLHILNIKKIIMTNTIYMMIRNVQSISN